jgi:hypothetical protein
VGALLDLALEVDPEALAQESDSAAVREREQRVDQATRMLREVLTRRAAFVAGEECDGVIPVTVVLSTPHGLVTGDLTIPKDRWDPWLFLQFLRE